MMGLNEIWFNGKHRHPAFIYNSCHELRTKERTFTLNSDIKGNTK